MKSLANYAMGIFVLVALAFCGNVRGQDAPPSPTDGGAQAAASDASSSQSNAHAKSARSSDTYVIGDDDVLVISVWKEPELSKQVTVRSDGKISLPLAGDLQATGRTPLQLAEDITSKLRNYITDPQVTVIVQQINSQKFNVLGQVAKPGSYSLTAGETIVDAIATAGGFRDFAKRKGVYVIRQNPNGGETRIPFNYEKFIKGQDPAQNIEIKPHDTIVVP